MMLLIVSMVRLRLMSCFTTDGLVRWGLDFVRVMGSTFPPQPFRLLRLVLCTLKEPYLVLSSSVPSKIRQMRVTKRILGDELATLMVFVFEACIAAKLP